MTLIKLTKTNGDVFYLNAEKILSVHPINVEGQTAGAVVYHEPYNSENGLDWENVTETPEQIAEMSTLCAYVK